MADPNDIQAPQPDPIPTALPPDPGELPVTPSEPNIGQLAGAALRQGNVGVSFWDRYMNNPPPGAKPIPGFDLSLHVPDGYSQWADKFVGLSSPEEVDWMRKRIDAENRDRATIAHSGSAGYVASLAAGATDPLTLASMLVPVGGEANVVRLARLAALSGGTTAAQEGLDYLAGLHVTRTPSERADAIVGGTVVPPLLSAAFTGGRSLLAGIYRGMGQRVSSGTFGAQARAAERDLYDPDSAHQPIAGTAKPDPLQGVPHEVRVPAGPLKAKPIGGSTPEVDPETMSLLQAVSVSKVKGAEKRGIDIDDAADLLGVDRSELKGLKFGNKRAFTSGGAKVDDMLALFNKRKFGYANNREGFLQALVSELDGVPHYSEHAVSSASESVLGEIRDSPGYYEQLAQYEEAEHEISGSDVEHWSQEPPEQRNATRKWGATRAPVSNAPLGHPDFLGPDLVNPPVEPPAGVLGGGAGGPPAAGAGPGGGGAGGAAPAAGGGGGGPGAGGVAGHTPAGIPAAGQAAGGAPPAAPKKAPLPGIPVVTGPDESVGRGAKTIARKLWGKWFAPSMQLLSSPSKIAQRLSQDLFDIPETLAKNDLGIATPVPIERELQKIPATIGWLHERLVETYNAYLQAHGVSGLGKLLPGAGVMTLQQFDEAAGRAMSDGDAHVEPAVVQYARYARGILDDVSKRAQTLGALPQQLKPAVGAKSYFPRMYRIMKIQQERGEWDKTLRDWYTSQPGGAMPLLDAHEMTNDATRKILRFENSSEAWRQMNGTGAIQVGPFKDRTITVPDHLLEPYLHKGVSEVMDRWLRNVIPDLSFRERFGNTDLGLQMQQVKEEYLKMHMDAEARLANDPVKLNKEKAFLTAREKSDEAMLGAARDRHYNRFHVPEDPAHWLIQVPRTIRAWGVVTQLGTAALSHITDIGNTLVLNGLPNTAAALPHFMNPLKDQIARLSLQNAKWLGAAWETLTNTVNKTQGDYGNLARGPVGQFLNNLTGGFNVTKNVRVPGFTTLSGESLVLDRTQALGSMLAGHNILTAAEDRALGKPLSSMDVRHLASYGLEGKDLDDIYKNSRATIQLPPHLGGPTPGYSRIGGWHFGHPEIWPDQNVADKFESAVLASAHRVTLRPGHGDMPLLLQRGDVGGEIAKTLLQFSSFGFAARGITSRIAQDAAHGDFGRTAGSVLGLLGLGYITYWLKQRAADMPAESPLKHPGKVLEEVLDRSNVLGPMSRALPITWQLGSKELSRWGDSNPAEVLFGPGIGKVSALWENRPFAKLGRSMGLVDDPSVPPFEKKDVHFLRRLVPFQNHWLLRGRFNEIEDWISNNFDLPGISQQQQSERRWAQAEMEDEQ